MSDTASYSSANAVSAAKLLGSFGVNTHTGLDGAYGNSALILRSLNYLDIHSVRNGISSFGVPAQVASAMAKAGVDFDVVVSSNVAAGGAAGVKAYVDTIAAFAAANPGSVRLIEGQNEVNLFGTNLGGDTSFAAAVSIQQLLYTSVKANSVLSNVGVLNLTIGHDDLNVYSQIGDLSAYSDYANAHVYPGPASNIAQRYTSSVALASAASSGHQTIITETGFTTYTSAVIGVDELAQAKMTLAEMLRAYDQGSVKTYLYSLFDTPGVEANTANNYYGLFHADGTPKIAATAIHNLTTLLEADQGHAMAGTIQVSGLGTDGHSMNVAKSSGATDLVLWRDVSSWNPTTGSTASVTPTQVTVKFSSVQAHVYVYSPVDGLTPIASYTNVSSITLPVADTPLIIELGTDQPLVVAPDAAPSATMSFNESSFVAQIDDLSHMTGLSKVTLTGNHVLEVSSVDTMKDILANYAGVLAKIDGGYSFLVRKTGSGWETDTSYDKAGNLVSTVVTGAKGTGTYSSQVVNSDGSTATYNFSNGVLIKEVTLQADGSRSTINYDSAGRELTRTDVSKAGVQTYWTYSAATGEELTKTVTNPDKSGEMYHYAITGQAYASDHYVYGAGGAVVKLERFYADGALQYSSTNQADGSRIVDTYDTKGHKIQEIVVAVDNSRATTNYTYDATGHLTSRTDITAAGVTTYLTYNAATGALTSKTITNPDKSGQLWHYAITGQSYTSDHYVYAVGGGVAKVERFYGDGTTAYTSVTKADGSRVVDNYNTAGKLTQEVAYSATGTQIASITNVYDGSGRLTARTDINATNVTTYQTYNVSTGAVTSKTITNPDKSGELWHYGITGQSYTSDHYVYAVGGGVAKLERFYGDGTLSYSSVTKADGGRVVDNFNTAGKLTQEVTFSASGVQTATSTLVYDSGNRLTARTDVDAAKVMTYQTYNVATGAVTTKTITNPDKSGEMWHYALTGQSYTSDHYVYGIGGTVVKLERFYADGTMAYSSVNKADGSRVVDNYDTAGHMTQELVIAANGTQTSTTYAYDSANRLAARTDISAAKVTTYQTYATTGTVTSKTITNPDKSGEMWHYGITGQSYTSDHFVYAVGGGVAKLERYYGDGTLAYTSVTKADGGRVVDNFNQAGKLTQEVAYTASGTQLSSSLLAYDSTGHLTSRTDVNAAKVTTYSAYDPMTGALKSKTITNPDKSGDMWHYGVTGQSFTSDHYTYGVGGVTTSVTRMHADGTLDYYAEYHADGSKMTELYNTAGQKTLTTLVGASGADSFVVPAKGVNTTISNFDYAAGDKIDLTKIDAVTNNTAGTLDHFSLVGAFSGQAGQLIATQDKAYGDNLHWLVQGDTNGDGKADFILHVTEVNSHILGAADLLLR